MIVISDDLFLSTPAGVDLNAPVVGWQNAATALNVSADDSDVNFPVANVANPSVYLKWKSTITRKQHVSSSFVTPTPVDYLAIAGHNFGTARIAAAVEGASTVSDASQKVLLHFEGADATTSIVDNNVGGSAHVWTPRGNAQIDTAIFKIGTSALLCDGTGDWVDTPNHTDFALAANDFTVDAWFFNAAAGGAFRGIAGQMDSVAGSNAARSWYLGLTSGNFAHFSGWVGGSETIQLTGTTQFTSVLNPGWHHVAVTRSGSTFRLFIDGIMEASSTNAVTIQGSTSVLSIGALADNVFAPTWTGSIDEFRLLNGRAAWTANFVPEAFAYDQFDWEPLGDEQLPPDDSPIVWRFAKTTLMAVRLRAASGTAPPQISVMYAGALLQLQRRIYVGHRVLQYNRRSNVVAGFSDDATFLGRLVLGDLKESSLDLQNITPAFFRSDVDPWLQNSVSKPFFFAWRPQSYPLEVGFCWLTNDPAMTNQRPNGMVQVSMGLRGAA